MGANIKVIPELFYVAAGACGVGASILWTAQGSYLAKNSDKDTLGRNTGIFFGILQVNMVVGNLIGSTLRKLNQPYWILFTAFTVIGAVGASSFLMLRQTKTKKTNSFESTNSGYESGSVDAEPAPEQSVSIIGRFVNTLKLLASGRFALLAPIIIYSGLSQAFFFGVYSKMVSSYDDSMTGFVFAVFGAFDVLGSFVCGKLIDIVGRKPIFFLGGIFTLAGTLTLLMVEKSFLYSNVYMYFIIGAVFGISDGAMNGAIYGAIGSVFGNDVENGFGAFRLLQSSTTAAHFFAQRFLDNVPFIDLGILDVFLLLGLMSLLILDFCVAPLDPPKEEKRSTTGIDD
jgi:MFS family permease